MFFCFGIHVVGVGRCLPSFLRHLFTLARAIFIEGIAAEPRCVSLLPMIVSDSLWKSGKVFDVCLLYTHTHIHKRSFVSLTFVYIGLRVT